MSGGISRFSLGVNPPRMAARACTMSALAPASATAAANSREKLVVIALIDADAAFDGDRQVRRVAHAPHALGDQRRAQHEAGAERALLHAVARAADVQVDLREPRRGADARRLRELAGIAAPELQRHRMLERVDARAGAAHCRAPWPPPRSSPCRATRAARTADAGTGNGGRSSPSSERPKRGDPAIIWQKPSETPASAGFSESGVSAVSVGIPDSLACADETYREQGRLVPCSRHRNHLDTQANPHAKSVRQEWRVIRRTAG